MNISIQFFASLIIFTMLDAKTPTSKADGIQPIQQPNIQKSKGPSIKETQDYILKITNHPVNTDHSYDGGDDTSNATAGIDFSKDIPCLLIETGAEKHDNGRTRHDGQIITYLDFSKVKPYSTRNGRIQFKDSQNKSSIKEEEKWSKFYDYRKGRNMPDDIFTSNSKEYTLKISYLGVYEEKMFKAFTHLADRCYEEYGSTTSDLF